MSFGSDTPRPRREGLDQHTAKRPHNIRQRSGSSGYEHPHSLCYMYMLSLCKKCDDSRRRLGVYSWLQMQMSGRVKGGTEPACLEPPCGRRKRNTIKN